jgi:hypothetical protein
MDIAPAAHRPTHLSYFCHFPASGHKVPLNLVAATVCLDASESCYMCQELPAVLPLSLQTFKDETDHMPYDAGPATMKPTMRTDTVRRGLRLGDQESQPFPL